MKIKHEILNYRLLTLSIGIIYFWFGILKFFPNVSPAENLAKETIDILTLALIPSNISLKLLATIETLIGIILIINIWRKTVIKIALIHISLTFLKVLLFPSLMFEEVPFQFTLLGQYILKNWSF